MPSFVFVYVPTKYPSPENYQVGKDKLIWGWKDDALDQTMKGQPHSARDVVASLSPQDHMVFGHRVPLGPRGNKGKDPLSVSFGHVMMTRVTKPLYQGTIPVWTDEQEQGLIIYPNRIEFEIVWDEEDVVGASLGPEVVAALLQSGNNQGAPITVGSEALAFTGFTGEAGSEPIEEPEPVGSAVVSPPDPGKAGLIDFKKAGVDSRAWKKVREEQRDLKKGKFGAAKYLDCALCGRTLPATVVRAAHIKARKYCQLEEYLQLANIMPACALGCDELFEHGYVYVDKGGFVRAAPSSADTPELAQAAKALDGRTCSAMSTHSKDFYAFHRAKALGKV